MKKKVVECEYCAKYSQYFKKGVSKRQMIEVGQVGTGILYQCPNLECNRLKIL